MNAFLCLKDADKRRERYIRIDQICAVDNIASGQARDVVVTRIGGLTLKLAGEEANQFLDWFAKSVRVEGNP